MTSRRIISQLPGVLQTEPLSKLLGATADHLFQPGQGENLSGYIGRRDLSYYDVTKDFYLPEATPGREAHQLDAAMVSFGPDGRLLNALFYDDVVNYLRSQGALVDDHNRLFEGERYSWAPPVDIDKLMNFSQYLWYGDAPHEQPALVLRAPRTIDTGNGATQTFALPPAAGMDVAAESVVVLVDGVQVAQQSRTADTVTLLDPPAVDAMITVFRHSDLRAVLRGTTNFDPSQINIEGVTRLTSGMRVILEDGLSARGAWDQEVSSQDFDIRPWDYAAANDFYLEDAGTGLRLIDFRDFRTEPTPSYVVMDRACRDANPWARANRWVHRDSVSWRAGAYTERRARRPIVEFSRDLKLWQYGRRRLEDIQGTITQHASGGAQVEIGWDTVAWDAVPGISVWEGTSVDFRDLNGEVEGTLLADWQPWGRTDASTGEAVSDALMDQQRVIILGVPDNSLGDAVYRVRTVQGRYMLVAENDGQEGDVIRLKSTDAAVPDREFYHDGQTWVPAQPRQRGADNPLAAPLFDLYDGEGVSLGDPGLYPGNEFAGNRLFGYAESATAVADAVLDVGLERDNNGEIVFEVHAATRRASYLANGMEQEITGLYYHRVLDVTEAGDRYRNNWTASQPGLPITSLRPTRRHHSYAGGTPAFSIPEEFLGAPVEVSLDGVSLDAARYSLRGNRLVLGEAPAVGTLVDIAFHGPGDIYEVPVNLRANPGNFEVEKISRGQWYDHFSGVMLAQSQFAGQPFAGNNWRDIPHDLSLGRRIIQHRTPLLKTMLLASDSRFDMPLAIQTAEAEYSRFRARFLTRALDLVTSGAIMLPTGVSLADISREDWQGFTETVLLSLRQNKSPEFPFAVSGVAGNGYYVPPTPAALGVLPVSRPGFVGEDIRGHDGSLTMKLGDLRDHLLLALEERIYDSIPARFRTEERPSFDLARYHEGKFRGVPAGGYSRAEVTRILAPSFERWTQTMGADYRTNATFIAADRFTWNYATCRDASGAALPGYWRAIYRHFFDTDRPDIRPWEMLGFTDQPVWWEEEYGPAPYLPGNTALWDDLTAGRIAQGPRAGTDPHYARPGLLAVLPIDEDGLLLDPIQARLVTAAPTYQDASAPWQIGDHGPVEEYWLSTPQYPFALALAGFLMKPARMVESCWDSLSQQRVHGDQWVLEDGYRARDGDNAPVHGEYAEDGITQKQVWGIQQWVSDLMAARGQSASALGEAVRGLSVRLGYKMAGFTTKDNLRVVADNFGLVPDEDIRVEVYRSPSVREEVYTGVIIEWAGNGWRVVGYDAIDPNFQVAPGDPNGAKAMIRTSDAPEPVINPWRPNTYYTVGVLVSHQSSVYAAARGHTSAPSFEQGFWVARPGLSTPTSPRVVRYLAPLGTVERVPYGTVLRDAQAVADFLFALARQQTQSGWVFEDATDTAGGWSLAVKQFLLWSSQSLQPGSFIALSPAGSRLRFRTDFGTILPAERMFRGVYGLLGRTGQPIDGRDTLVRRLDGEIAFASTAGDMHAARVSIGEVEHVLLFSNTTIFDDIIYAPLYDLRQPRLRLIGQRSRDWVGRFEAPGYVIVDGQIASNFETMAEDIRGAFGIERANNKTLRDYARHVVGYQSRGYLRDLFLSDTQQFEFYQGMIQQKGVPNVFDKLVRSYFVDQNRNLQFFDEWAIKVGEYGARSSLKRLAFLLRHSDIRRDPQFIQFRHETTLGNDDWIELVDTASPSPLWVERPQEPHAAFPQYADYALAPGAMPTAGYARLDEANGTAPDMAALHARFDAEDPDGGFYEGHRWWVYHGPRNSWEMLRVTTLPSRIASLTTYDDDPNVRNSRLTFYAPHGLTEADIDAHVVIGPDPALEEVQGIRQITRVNVAQNWIEVYATALAGHAFGALGEVDQGPGVSILRPTRFAEKTALDATSETILPRQVGDLAYVDGDNRNLPWTVHRWTGDAWAVVRSQPRKIMSSRIASALLYDLGTHVRDGRLCPEPLVLDSMVLVDPVGGLVPGVADREISYKTEYDPASYVGPGQVSTDAGWGAAQVGTLWWDISTVRFMEAETDDVAADDISQAERLHTEMRYRASQWGRVAPGASVDLYEWVDSDVPPYQWAETQQGTPRGSEIEGFEWSEGAVYNPDFSAPQARYYFWVKGRTTLPSGLATRRLDAEAVARIILNPANLNTPWIAPVATNGLLIGGAAPYLDDEGTVVQIVTRVEEQPGEVHQQWKLMRQGDERSQPDDMLWRKLRDSLAGFDDRLRPIPGPGHPSQQTGLLADQSMFSQGHQGMLDARRSFVEMANIILARTNLSDNRASAIEALEDKAPIDADTPPIGQYAIWAQGTAAEPIQPLPPRHDPATGFGMWDLEVSSIDERNALLFDPAIHARTTPLRVLVNGLSNTVPQWSVWLLDMAAIDRLRGWTDTPEALLEQADVKLNASGEEVAGFFRLAKNYTDRLHVVDTLVERDSLTGLVDRERVLVRGDAAFQGFWTIWQYNTSRQTFDPKPVAAQTFRLADFWDYIDWYAEGYGPASAPRIHYATVTERNVTEGLTNPRNTLVRIKDDSGRWSWTAWVDGTWTVVARERGTIALAADFYATDRSPFGLTDYNVGQIATRDGRWEMRFLADTLRATVLTDLEVNELLFSMLHFIHAQQDRVDWAFKTNFLTVAGYREPLIQSAIKTSDNTESLMSYIEEVKPYRVKLREFTRSLTANIDDAPGRGTDFDKPPYWDEDRYRPLRLNRPADLATLRTQPWKDWHDNYTKSEMQPDTVDYNPIRRMTVRMKFDRVSAEVTDRPIIGQQAFVYSGGDPSFTIADRYFGTEVTVTANGQSLPKSAIAVDDTTVTLRAAPGLGDDVVLSFREAQHAADRIAAHYKPGPGMRENDLDDLLRVGFQGTAYEGERLVNRSERDVDLDANGDPEVEAKGYGLRDPFAVHRRPEEAVSAGAAISIALHINDRSGNGAVPQGSRFFHVGDNAAAVSVTLGLPVIAQGGDAVAVFRDGYRAREGASHDYVVDLLARTVTVRLDRGADRVRRIAVHAFGPAATTAVLDRRFYAATGEASFAIPAEYVGADVEVVVSGNRLMDDDYSVSGETVTLATPPEAGTPVILVFRATDGGNPVRIETRTQVLPYAADRTWTLAHPSSSFPAHETTVAELNGRRLTPPDTLHTVLEPFTRVMETRRVFAHADLVLHCAGLEYPIRDGNAANSLAEAIDAAPGDTDFVLFGNQIAALNDDLNGEVIIQGFGRHHYTVSDTGDLTLLAPMVEGDVLTVTTFVNADAMKIHTAVLGTEMASFRLRPPPRSDLSWVTYDGRRIEAQQDYTFDGGGLTIRPDLPATHEVEPGDGFDMATDGFDTDGWALGGSPVSNDIVVTLFSGKPTRELGEWMVHMRHPADSVLEPTAEMPGRFLFDERHLLAARLRPEFAGVLASDLGPHDSEISVTVGSTQRPTEMMAEHPFPLPDITVNRPGVVWINDERIEYFSLIRSGDTVTFRQLRRATHGTSRGEHRQVTNYLTDGNTYEFLLPGAAALDHLEITVAGRRLRPGEYTAALAQDAVSVSLPAPPLAGAFVTIARSAAQPLHPSGSLVHGATTATVDIAYVLNSGSAGNTGEPYDDYLFHTDETGFVI